MVDVFHDLSVQTAGTGEGTVTGLGIDCGTTCTATYDAGTIMTLTATPADDLSDLPSVFTGWSGDCAGEAETCQVTMDAAKNVTASFAPLIEEPPVEEPPTNPPPAPPPASSPPVVDSGTAPAPTPSTHAKRRKCKRGFKKRKVRGKARCVKKNKKRRR